MRKNSKKPQPKGIMNQLQTWVNPSTIGAAFLAMSKAFEIFQKVGVS